MKISDLGAFEAKIKALDEQLEIDLADGQITEEEAVGILKQIDDIVELVKGEPVEDDEAEYSSGEPIVTFSEAEEEMGSNTGGALLDLGEYLGYDDAALFISDLARELGEPTTYVAEVVRGDKLPDPYFAQNLVTILMQKQAIDEDEAEAILLDMVDCGNTDYQRAEQMALASGSYQQEAYVPSDDFQSREREYFQALLDMEDREKMRQNDLKQEMEEMKYSLGEIYQNIQFNQDYESLTVAFEEQRERAEKLVDNGILTPSNYEYYFGNRDVFPDKYKLTEAFVRKAEKENTSLISEFNINERILTDLEDKNSEVMQNFYAAGSSTVQFSDSPEQRSDPYQDPYIMGLLERNYPEYAQNLAGDN